MKSSTYPMPICFTLGLLFMGVVAWLVSAMLQAVPALLELHWIILLIPAVLCSVGALIAHRCAKGRTAAYLLSYGANAIGSGWAVGALMGMKGILPAMTLVQSLLPALFLHQYQCASYSRAQRSCVRLPFADESLLMQ